MTNETKKILIIASLSPVTLILGFGFYSTVYSYLTNPTHCDTYPTGISCNTWQEFPTYDLIFWGLPLIILLFLTVKVLKSNIVTSGIKTLIFAGLGVVLLLGYLFIFFLVLSSM